LTPKQLAVLTDAYQRIERDLKESQPEKLRELTAAYDWLMGKAKSRPRVEETPKKLLEPTVTDQNDDPSNELASTETAVEDAIEPVDEICDDEQERLALLETQKESWRTSALPPPDVVVVSFPPKDHRAYLRGSCPREFRRWLRSSVVKKVVFVSHDCRAMAKDIRHMSNLGYDLNKIKVLDTGPDSMDVTVIAGFELRPIELDTVRPPTPDRLAVSESHPQLPELVRRRVEHIAHGGGMTVRQWQAKTAKRRGRNCEVTRRGRNCEVTAESLEEY